MHNLDPTDAQLDAPTASEVEALELFRRSPHPYLRHRADLSNNHTSSDTSSSNVVAHQTPPRSSDRTISDQDGRKRRKLDSQSPSESGTEADDEGYQFVKALPAPPLRPRKGLRDRKGLREEGLSPLLTPTQIEEEVHNCSNEYFKDKDDRSKMGVTSSRDEEARAARQKYLKRRRNEVVRRTTETALLAGIGFLAVSGCGCWPKLLEWHRGEFDSTETTLAAARG
jgi:hypothetical protein